MSPQVKRREYPLRRGGLYYITHNGIELVLPSVTSILGGAVPKPPLVSWAARTAATYALANPHSSIEEAAGSIYRTKDIATDKGKAIHTWAEEYANGNPINVKDLPPELQSYGKAFQHFIDRNAPKIIYAEGVVFNVTYGYAGSFDVIAELPNGKLTMYDYKTGKSTYKESHLQQEAYAHAEWLMTKNKKIIPMPKIDYKNLVHLQNNGTSAVIGVDEPFEDFLTIMNAWKIYERWKKDS